MYFHSIRLLSTLINYSCPLGILEHWKLFFSTELHYDVSVTERSRKPWDKYESNFCNLFLAVSVYDYTKNTLICCVIRLHRARHMCVVHKLESLFTDKYTQNREIIENYLRQFLK